MSELGVPAATCIFEISYRSGYVVLLFLHLLLLLIETFAHCQNVVRLSLFYGHYFGYVHLNWLSRFRFLILEGGPVVILIECMIFLPFLDVIRMFMSAGYFLIQSDFGILCLQSVPLIYDLNGFKSTVNDTFLGVF